MGEESRVPRSYQIAANILPQKRLVRDLETMLFHMALLMLEPSIDFAKAVKRVVFFN